MTLSISDILFGIAAILFAIEFSRNKSLMTVAMGFIAVGLIFAL